MTEIHPPIVIFEFAGASAIIQVPFSELQNHARRHGYELRVPTREAATTYANEVLDGRLDHPHSDDCRWRCCGDRQSAAMILDGRRVAPETWTYRFCQEPLAREGNR